MATQKKYSDVFQYHIVHLYNSSIVTGPFYAATSDGGSVKCIIRFSSGGAYKVGDGFFFGNFFNILDLKISSHGSLLVIAQPIPQINQIYYCEDFLNCSWAYLGTLQSGVKYLDSSFVGPHIIIGGTFQGINLGNITIQCMNILLWNATKGQWECLGDGIGGKNITVVQQLRYYLTGVFNYC